MLSQLTNLKVVHKISAGFIGILLLLWIASMLSMGRLAIIERSSEHVRDIAVPIQKQSNQLQISLLKLAKLSTLSFNNDTISTIEASSSQFGNDTQSFERQLDTLVTLTAQQPDAKQYLMQASNNYSQYTGAVNLMHQAIKARIQAAEQVDASYDELNNAIDEAGAVLMELGYLEDGGSQQVLEQIAGSAGQLDGYLLNVVKTAKEVVLETHLDKVEAAKESTSFTISDLNAQIDYLKNLAHGVDTGGLMEQFLTEYAKAAALLTGDNNLLTQKLAQLQYQADARNQLTRAETQVNQASANLDKLLAAADSQFNQLQDEVLDNVDTGQTHAKWILAIMTLLGVACAIWIAKLMLGPLEGINKVLSYMAQGDLSRKLEVNKQDEFGLLSHHINEVVDDLTELISQIVSNSKQLTDAAKQSSDEILQMTACAGEQMDKVRHVTGITEDMAQSVSYVSQQASTAADEMLQALKQSEQVDNIAGDNNRRIAELEQQLEQTTGVIHRLQRESENIGGILETIRGIAEQTNLLALNAAIEAARAGEQGRGFAVVADEVRSLAGRTQHSTAEIQTMIENLQRQTSSAVEDITKGKAQATECVKYTDELTNSLHMINQAIGRMQSMSDEIANAAEQQLGQSCTIRDEMAAVVTIAESNSTNAQSTLAYSADVAGLAADLNDSVNTFKV